MTATDAQDDAAAYLSGFISGLYDFEHFGDYSLCFTDKSNMMRGIVLNSKDFFSQPTEKRA